MEGVKKAGVLVGARKQLNFIEGSNITIAIDDDSDSNNDIDITITASGTTGIAESIFDAKGDLIAATAADTASRLAVGTDGDVLTADSSTATGVKWAAPGASSHPAVVSHLKWGVD